MNNLKDFTLRNNLIIFFIAILPISIIAGSAISNLIIILIDIYFIYEIFKNKLLIILKNKLLYFLLIIWFLLLLNSIFVASSSESFIRSFGFLRFIILIFALKYFLEKNNNNIKNLVLKIWFFIFIIVTVDILIEFYFGSNILGFKSNYNGRVASFTGDELKIGNYYFGFVLITLSFFYQNYCKKNYLFLYILILIFLITSFFIGERSNFIKTFIISFLFIFLINNKDILKKLFIFLLFILVFFSTISKNEFYKERMFSEFLNPIIKGNYNSFLKNSLYAKHVDIAKNIYKENFFLGVGLKNYRYASLMKKYNQNDNLEGAASHPHQIHYEFLSETGITGYIIFIIFFMLSMINGFKKFLKSKNPYILSSVLFLLATALPLIPSGSFFTSYGASIFWINYSFLLLQNEKYLLN